MSSAKNFFEGQKNYYFPKRHDKLRLLGKILWWKRKKKKDNLFLVSKIFVRETNGWPERSTSVDFFCGNIFFTFSAF